MNGPRVHAVCPNARRPTRFGCRLAVALGIAALTVASARAQSSGSTREYDIKAAFLYHFVQFVEWPDEVDGTDPLMLCVLGRDPFGESIDDLEGREARGRAIRVRRLTSGADAGGCSVLYVAATEDGAAPDWLDRLASMHVLTVGDDTAFTERGGAIRFYKLRNRIRFEVNLDAARRAGLKISSQMLKLASVV